MPVTRPPYPQEFREQIVALHRAGRTIAELAREFEPSPETIRQWVRSAGPPQGTGGPGGGAVAGAR